MPAAAYRLRQPAAAILRELEHAEPARTRPRGYFDALMEPTKKLLDKGFRLHKAAAWLIERGAMPPQDRDAFMGTMRHRFTRLRQSQASTKAVCQWKTALGYEAAHAVAGVTAVCGATAGRWFAATPTTRHCPRCQGIVTRENVTIHR